MTSDGGELEADAVVLALPARQTSDLVFDPPLPDRKRAALDALVYGQAAKLFVALAGAVPPSATLSVPGASGVTRSSGPDGRPLPIAGSFAGTQPAIDALGCRAGTGALDRRAGRAAPDLRLDPEQAMVVTWHDDPWALGAYSARSLASPMDDEELARPLGCLAFAGEHTAAGWHGLMEGALRSGQRAAREAMAAAAHA